MVWQNNMKDVSEVFSIDAENFKLWATLASVKGGKSRVRGWVKFKNEKKIRFSREGDDQNVLRKRLLFACGPIATFYGSELVHQKIQMTGREIRDYSVMIPEGRMVH